MKGSTAGTGAERRVAIGSGNISDHSGDGGNRAGVGNGDGQIGNQWFEVSRVRIESQLVQYAGSIHFYMILQGDIFWELVNWTVTLFELEPLQSSGFVFAL